MKNFQNKTKIVKVSKILRHIAFAGLVVWMFAIPTSLAAAVFVAKQLPGEITAFLMVPMFVFAFITNLKIFRFFDRLKNGSFFDAQTVGYLNSAATWWFVLWLYEVFSYVALQHPWSNVHDFSLYHFPPDSGGLFAALTLKFVAWFFREAQELQEEQELTV